MDIAHFGAAGLVRLVAPAIIAKLCTVHGYLSSSPASSPTVTSGMNATKPGAGWAIIAGAVGGIESLTKGLAVDLAPIRVNCVSPGAVYTELFQNFGGDKLEATLEYFKAKSTTKTMGKPKDLAEAYLYCMRDQFVTGAIIESNSGGLLA
jgi:NAD(P)-dependent dehydrogenase (short-subunit alcohol dehydrogenase family)